MRIHTQRNSKGAAVFYAVVGLFLVSLGISTYNDVKSYYVHAVTATGTVVDNVQHTKINHGNVNGQGYGATTQTIYDPVVRFTLVDQPGVTHTAVATLNGISNTPIGTQITISYNRDNPNQARADNTAPDFEPFLYIFLGILMLFFAVSNWHKAGRSNSTAFTQIFTQQ